MKFLSYSLIAFALITGSRLTCQEEETSLPAQQIIQALNKNCQQEDPEQKTWCSEFTPTIDQTKTAMQDFGTYVLYLFDKKDAIAQKISALFVDSYKQGSSFVAALAKKYGNNFVELTREHPHYYLAAQGVIGFLTIGAISYAIYKMGIVKKVTRPVYTINKKIVTIGALITLPCVIAAGILAYDPVLFDALVEQSAIKLSELQALPFADMLSNKAHSAYAKSGEVASYLLQKIQR